MSSQYTNQNDLLLKTFKGYYADQENMDKMISIINGQSAISLRIVDWFTTNYSKKYWTVYNIEKDGENIRFKVFDDYKLKLKAYSKKDLTLFAGGIGLRFRMGTTNLYKRLLDS